MINEHRHFKLFSCCMLVKGASRSGICDVQRGAFEYIPNDLYNVLLETIGLDYKAVIDKYGEENAESLNEYFLWLVEMEFGFWCDTYEEWLGFPTMDLKWNKPEKIVTAIVDINENSNYDIKTVLHQLDKLTASHIQLRSFSIKPIDFFINAVADMEGSNIKTVDIVTPFIKEYEVEFLQPILHTHLRINSIIFFSSPFNKRIDSFLSGLTMVDYITQTIEDSSHCGLVHSGYFTITLPLFTESQKHNTCLNRKISVDINGEIKNCPSMSKSYGNIKDTTLIKALDTAGFKDLWNINKDQINVCKDCEFRHICTDCRAYIEEPENSYSKPLKCGYDPYTAKWEEWSTNPLKQKAIEYYESKKTA